MYILERRKRRAAAGPDFRVSSNKKIEKGDARAATFFKAIWTGSNVLKTPRGEMDARLAGNEDFSPAGSRQISFHWFASSSLVRGGSFLSVQREGKEKGRGETCWGSFRHIH